MTGALRPLAGGCVGEVHRFELADGTHGVAKVDGSAEARLALEGRMLGVLADAGLPVPRVLHAADDLLLMEFVESGPAPAGRRDEHAADLLAALHEHTAPAHGLDFDTLIGGLNQPNPWTGSWVEFFREHRLLSMAREAHRAGRLPAATLGRVEALAPRLGDLLREPPAPALLHGDVWSGNVLPGPRGVAAFLDPAVYHGDPEIELAFTRLFGTFGPRFYDRYRERRGLEPGFLEERCDLLNLYPLLVHVRLFGGSYVDSVERTLARFS